MKTASFFAYTGPGRICIARWAPRGTPAGFRVYKPLAPRKDMLRMSEAEYRDIYVGEIGNPGNWGDPGKEWFGLERLRPNGAETFELLEVRARAGGFTLRYEKSLFVLQSR